LSSQVRHRYSYAIEHQRKTNGWVWLGASSTQPPTLFYAEKLGHDASAVKYTSLDADKLAEGSISARAMEERRTIDGGSALPAAAGCFSEDSADRVETHCAFSLTGAGIRSLAQPVARPQDFVLSVIVSTKKHRLPK